MKKIVNFGSINIDYVYDVDHFVQAGETLSSVQFSQNAGGKGFNQSIALSLSGANVWHAGCVGSDDSGFLLELLQQSGVKTDYIKKIEGKTGHAIIQRDVSGQNCILLYGGANQQVQREYIDEVVAFINPGDFLVLQNEINEIAYLMEAAKQKAAVIVFNPSPADEKLIGYPLTAVDYFILNEIEAAQICGREGTADELSDALLQRFPEAKIVLTLGSQGSVYVDKEARIRQGIYPVTAVDTTAAGDTFTGYFIGALIQGSGPKEALELAARASAIAVSRPGAGASIPRRLEVESEEF